MILYIKNFYGTINEIVKTYSKDNVELLISNIIESVKHYPREFLFISNKDEPALRSIHRNYLKKYEEDQETTIINKNEEKITPTNKNQQKPTQQAPRDRKQYLNDYYEKNKQKMKEQIKNNEKEKTYKIRLLRELITDSLILKPLENQH